MTGTQMKNNICIVICLVLFIVSCINLNKFDQNIPIKHSEWNIDNILRFAYNSEDTAHSKDVFINFRHTGLYKYNNIILFVTTLAPDGNSIKDTIEFTIADAKGKWVGSGIGDVSDVRLAYRHNVKFGQLGKYIFYIQHGMRDIKLEEVVDVGIRIQDAK